MCAITLVYYFIINVNWFFPLMLYLPRTQTLLLFLRKNGHTKESGKVERFAPTEEQRFALVTSRLLALVHVFVKAHVEESCTVC